MRDALAERLLASVMGWGPEDVARERPSLQAMAAFKYDEYQQFAPGERFVESLALWLGQFKKVEERRVAFSFVMERLIFISNAELQHFVATSFRDHIRPILLGEVAASLGRAPWEVVRAVNSREYAIHLRRCLILGLSDGARLDTFRRLNPELSHEQIWQTYQMPADRAESIENKLQNALLEFSGHLPIARFSSVLLLDDFAGSGMSFLRGSGTKRDGKLAKFVDSIEQGGSPLRRLLVTADLHVMVLLYVATERALQYLRRELEQVETSARLRFTLVAVHVIPERVTLHPNDGLPFGSLLENYCSPALDDEHLQVGGVPSVYGFNECGLPLVLSHNTPNNSVNLLWDQGTKQRALLGESQI